MDAPEVIELRTEQEFVGYTARGGVIIILDDANRSAAKRVAHLQTERKACSHIDIEHFREKVLANAEHNGRLVGAQQQGRRAGTGRNPVLRVKGAAGKNITRRPECLGP